jgi:hypothetical protein
MLAFSIVFELLGIGTAACFPRFLENPMCPRHPSPGQLLRALRCAVATVPAGLTCIGISLSAIAFVAEMFEVSFGMAVATISMLAIVVLVFLLAIGLEGRQPTRRSPARHSVSQAVGA